MRVFIAMLIAYVSIGFILSLRLLLAFVGLWSPYSQTILMRDVVDVIFWIPFVFIFGPVHMMIAHTFLFFSIWAASVVCFLLLLSYVQQRKSTSRSK